MALTVRIFSSGETVTMKKPHPCGGTEWEVVKTGAEIKMRCKTCGRYISLSPDEARKREKRTPITEQK